MTLMSITRKDIQTIVKDYDPDKLHVAIFGSHSALELGMAAKAHGLPSVIICQKGRDEVYRRNKHLYDRFIVLDNFKHMIKEDVQQQLRDLNAILVPNRSFSVYVGKDNDYRAIEEEFKVPIYGNRSILKAEDRKGEGGLRDMLERSGIRTPREFKGPEDIRGLAIVRVQQAGKELERAFFYAKNYEDYKQQAEERIRSGIITEEMLKTARIEEYVMGARFNANFHYYALGDVFDDFDFVGLSDRRQVNLQGFLNLPAKDQLKIDVPVRNEEIGHVGVTIRESQQSLAYDAASKLYNSEVLRREYPPGLIGPVGIQGAVQYSPENQKDLEFVVFDLSPRVPGDPAIGPTSPEMRNLSLKYNMNIDDPLDLIIMELKYAAAHNRLADVVT